MPEKYNPPFEINNAIVSLVAEIAELCGKISSTECFSKNPVLRRTNRIRTIHSSLAIEQNTLTLEQVTAVINGKIVIAPPKDIEEVKNAFEIYELLDTLNSYCVDDLLKAHGVMMKGLVQDAGTFRTRSVGVVDSSSGEVIHVGTLPDYVPELTEKLLNWVKESDAHPLIKSCVFHYEFEVIHPFSDGNGRTGRLWHTLILSKWNPLFAWLPIESIIFKNQKEYYSVINECNFNADSTNFIEFMLELIKSALEEAVYVGTNVGINVGINLEEKIIKELSDNSKLSAASLAKILNVSSRQVERILSNLKKENKIERIGSNKNGSWIVK